MIFKTVSSRIIRRITATPPHKAQIGVRCLGGQAASPLQESAVEEEMEWDNLGFSLVQTDYMYVMKCGEEESEFEAGQLSRFGNIELSPAAGVLNYGQGVFEGTKAYRSENGGLFLFRPQDNAIRMQIGADRMCMQSPSVHQFIHAVKQTALANRRWIPPPGKGSLYIRPLLIGSGPVLGVAPAAEYTFLVYASPVGNYFKEGTAAINLYVEDEFHRAGRGGAGGVKSVTNYAPVMKAMRRAKDKGFSDVLYLDANNKRDIEEVSASNVFMLKDNVISTPPMNGTILEGITRKSIMDIAQDLGYQVEERAIPIEELLEADEVFCTGTAVVVAPVGSITYKGNRVEYKMSAELGCLKLQSRLVGIQRGEIEDSRGWLVQIE
ncbi:Branched-chain-amino-acid aminotransferase, mitochondrial [Salvia divinorum]|uniref:Branched-chain-amino-acid aminotransferase n=1 Tax=Salvia divinorum TaxID=28513 RepID=A0ABD1G834_SALDI